MKKLNLLSWLKYCLIPALFIIISTKLQAQTPMFFKGGPGTSSNTIPMNTSGSHAQHLYEPADFNIPPTAGLITKIYLKNSTAGGSGTYTNFSVAFLQNNLAAFPNTTFLTGFTTALTSASITFNGNATAGGWYEIPLTTPFLYDPAQTLIVEIKYTSKTGGMSTHTTTSTGNKRLSIITAPGATTGNLSTIWGDFGMDIAPAAPCSNPIAGGTTTASATTACAGASINLNLSGNSTGSGLTYEWESSPNNTTYTSLAPAQAAPFLSTTITATSWYRCKLVCSGGTPVYSTPVQVTVPAPLNGIYTINNANPTAGTNFNSFTAAIDALNCGGVSGQVTFNVSPGTPYVETLNFGTISGVSAIRPVRFNGNGATVQFTNTTSLRQLITFDGTKHVRIDSLTLKSLDAAFGWGARITGESAYDSLTRCQFDLSSVTSTTAANINGIIFSSSTTSATGAGINGKHIYIANNHIKGSAAAGGLNYGIGIAAGGSDSNIIRNNLIENFYNNGIYIASARFTLVEGNEIHKANKTAGIVAGEGIYTASGDMSGSKITGNRIHTPGGTAGSTTVFRGLSLLGDGTVTDPVIVANNIIYNINQGGASSGIYVSTGLYNLIYHNTVSFDQVLGGTAINYGIYSTGANTGTEISNNLVSITAGTGGIKYGFYHVTANGISDAQKNNYYLNSSQAGVQNYGYYTTAYATQAAFQTAYPTLEIGSPAVNPQFTAPASGNFLPSNAVLHNAGNTLLAFVPQDIQGTTRSATPTIGAYEVIPTNINDAAVMNLLTPTGNVCATTVPVEVIIRNAGANNITSVQVNWRINGILQTPFSYTGTLVPGSASTGQNMDTIVIGNANLAAGANNLEIWTSLPNGVADSHTGNDSLITSVTTTSYVVNTASDTICSNATTTLALNPSSGYAPGAIEWQSSPNGTTWTTIAGSNNPSHQVINLNSTTSYRAKIATNNVTCYSNTKTLTVQNPVLLSTTPGERCGPGIVSLAASANPGTDINWYTSPTGGTAVGTGTTFTTPAISATTTYYAAASVGGGNPQPNSLSTINTGGNSCGGGVMFDIDPNVNIIIDSFKARSGQAGTNVTVNVYTKSGTFQGNETNAAAWTLAGTVVIPSTTANNVFNIPLPTPININANNLTGVFINYYASYTNITTPTTYSNADIDIISGTGLCGVFTGTNPGRGFNGTVHYRLGGGCESTREPVIAGINEIPDVDLGNDTAICPAGSLTLDATLNGTHTYLWNNGATTPTVNVSTSGTYSVSVSNADCTGHDTIVVSNAPVPVATLPDSSFVCAGLSLTLDAGNSGAAYLWSDGSTNQTLDVHTGGLYTVNITNASACSIIDSTFLTVNNIPQVDLGNDTIICIGELLTLDAQNSGASFLWNNGAQTQTVTVSQEGIYSVTVTNADQCSAADTIEVSAYDAASVNGFHFTPRFDIEAGRVDFVPIDPVFVNSYHWDFGDGNTSTASTPSNVYASSGNYLVTLTVTNDCGPKDTSLLINVDLFVGVKTAQTAALNIDVFPVPAKNYLTIESKEQGLVLQKATVVNTIGQVIPLSCKKNGQSLHLDLKQMAEGNYIIIIETSKGKTYRSFNILK